jgi:hypothetical protein
VIRLVLTKHQKVACPLSLLGAGLVELGRAVTVGIFNELTAQSSPNR